MIIISYEGSLKCSVYFRKYTRNNYCSSIV